MPRFVLLDHSLRGFSGHHDLYARQLLGAAREAGFVPHLVAHRDYPAERAALDGVVITTPFEHTTYARYTLDAQAPATAAGWLGPLGAAWRKTRRERRIRAFASGCSAWARTVALEPGDVVFAATVSELDFAGLARFLAEDPGARRARWHAQFHWSPRRPDDPARSIEAVRESLRASLAALGDVVLELHCPTESLAQEYDRLGVARFRPLPYPVDPALGPRERVAHRGPLRIVMLGHPRREKGRELVPRLVRELWADGLAEGRAQLVVQARAGTRVSLPGSVATGVEPIVIAPPALAREDYLDLVRGADLGLLLYDRERYLTRCSGVLLELLAAGVPVVVPGGCWLADQVAEPAQAHLAALAAAGSPLHEGIAVDRDLLPRGEPFVFERTLARPMDALLGVRWDAPPPPGTYLQATWRIGQASGTAFIRPRAEEEPTWVLARSTAAAGGALPARFELRASGERFRLRDLALVGVERTEPGPTSAVGLVAGDPAEVPGLVREALRHHAHYRATAFGHARYVCERHAPSAVLAAVLGVKSPFSIPRAEWKMET